MRLLVITVFPPVKAPEADHAFRLCEELANYGLDVHVATQKGGIGSSRSSMTVHPIMRNWSWSELPRLARTMRRCSPDAVLLVFAYWIYNHPMITFVPTVSKRLMPRVPVVTLFEEARDFHSRISFLARAGRKVMELWAGRPGVNYCAGTLLRDSDRLIVVSDIIRTALAKLSQGVEG